MSRDVGLLLYVSWVDVEVDTRPAEMFHKGPQER